MLAQQELQSLHMPDYTATEGNVPGHSVVTPRQLQLTKYFRHNDPYEQSGGRCLSKHGEQTGGDLSRS